MFFPYTVQPTKITYHSKTVIDNIFSNYISQEIVSQNLTAAISYYIPQFFQMFQTKKQTYLDEIGQDSIMKNLF